MLKKVDRSEKRGGIKNDIKDMQNEILQNKTNRLKTDDR